MEDTGAASCAGTTRVAPRADEASTDPLVAPADEPDAAAASALAAVAIDGPATADATAAPATSSPGRCSRARSAVASAAAKSTHSPAPMAGFASRPARRAVASSMRAVPVERRTQRHWPWSPTSSTYLAPPCTRLSVKAPRGAVGPFDAVAMSPCSAALSCSSVGHQERSRPVRAKKAGRLPNTSPSRVPVTVPLAAARAGLSMAPATLASAAEAEDGDATSSAGVARLKLRRRKLELRELAEAAHSAIGSASPGSASCQIGSSASASW
mmetsp:Transcript_27871/g.75098  ORF Transcript_27871/g.75098 Transcript_27871/m.75098 type:complete len:269 (-) Transcript_27871:905-1711(-)